MAASTLPTHLHADQHPPLPWRTDSRTCPRTGGPAAHGNAQCAGTTTVLVGAGDPAVDIALLRLIPALAQRTLSVILVVHPRLVRLAQALDSSITVVPATQCLSVGRQIPLKALPRLLHPEIDTQSMDGLPYLHVPYSAAQACDQAIKRIAQGKPAIGLFGGQDQREDRAFQALKEIPGIAWIGHDIVGDARRHGIPCADFLDQAALLDCLDLVATTDITIALLAEGLGKEVWWLGAPTLVKRHLRKVDGAFPSLKLVPLAGPRGLAGVEQAIRTWYNHFYDQILARIAEPADRESRTARPRTRHCS